MYCEECGTYLEDNVRFCEECGTPIVQETDKNTNSLNSDIIEQKLVELIDENWNNVYRDFVNNTNKDLGIIITNLKKLSSQLNCSKEALLEVISSYISYCNKNHVAYCFVDVDNQKISSSNSTSVDNVVSILEKLCNISRPRYLFILGNEDVINVAVWKNHSGDSDKNVTSDLVYSTLVKSSPWEGCRFSFDKNIRVGRLPSYDGESLEKFCSYFINTMQVYNSFDKLVSYGLSAKVWKSESDYEFKNISKSRTDSSPNVNKEIVEKQIPQDANILFFNLHGSNQTKYWYGQEYLTYPEAFEPKNLSIITKPFFLGVEACYGANYIGNNDEKNSIVIKAMQSGCVGFLGSSKIAYGTPSPTGSCADFVVGEFLKQIVNGKTSGDAYILGLKRLVKETKSFSDAEIKTLAEFSLYGDPAQSINFTKNESKERKSIINFSDKKNIFVELPDIQTAIKMNLTKIDEKINKIINEYVYNKFSSVKGVVPTTYRIEGKDLYQSIYSNERELIPKIIKIYFDKNGNIKKELESK